MAQLKEDLPSEILEKVLARLPVHILCRSRLVCKAWNHLTTQPRFLSLRARTPRPASSVLITPKCVIAFQFQDKEGNSWTLLDMEAKQFYTLCDSSLVDFVKYDKLSKGLEWDKSTLAADGELVYVVLHQSFMGRVQIRHLIYNLVTKEFQQIEAPDNESYEIVVMSVEKATQSYRIIAMKPYNSGGGREEICVYDSTTTQWKKLGEHLSRVNRGFVTNTEHVFSSIFFKGIFYTLVYDFSTWCSKLYSCDLETGAWSHIDVAFPKPSHVQDKSQLVVSLGRLFCVEYTGLPWRNSVPRRKRKYVIKVTIWEILLAAKEVKKVVEMPKFSKYVTVPMHAHGMVALGCGDSIVISLLFGRNVRWDLLENRWHELPANSESLDGIYPFGGIFGSLVDY